MFDPQTATLADTPARTYGVVDISPSALAYLLGLSRYAIRRQRPMFPGKRKLAVPLAQVEEILGRTLSVHDFLSSQPCNRVRKKAAMVLGHGADVLMKPNPRTAQEQMEE